MIYLGINAQLRVAIITAIIFKTIVFMARGESCGFPASHTRKKAPARNQPAGANFDQVQI
jgi:hypothetical protein